MAGMVKHTQETLEALKDPAPARPAVSAAAGADEAERHVSSDTLAKVKKEKVRVAFDHVSVGT
eukprot:3090999-Amphidinium_carterae.1